MYPLELRHQIIDLLPFHGLWFDARLIQGVRDGMALRDLAARWQGKAASTGSSCAADAISCAEQWHGACRMSLVSSYPDPYQARPRAAT
jgi:hypothetical protein